MANPVKVRCCPATVTALNDAGARSPAPIEFLTFVEGGLELGPLAPSVHSCAGLGLRRDDRRESSTPPAQAGVFVPPTA